MSTSAAQLQFAAELVVFLVSVVGFAFAVRAQALRAPPTVRSLLGAGFLAASVAAFLRGSLLVAKAGTPALVALRLGGVALLVAGAARWSTLRPGGTVGADGERQARASALWLWLGLGLLLASEVLDHSFGGEVSDWVRLIGAVAIGAALLLASRRSIPGRIGAGAALLLLVVLLTVSITVSLVVAGNVEHEALDRYSNRANREAGAAVATAEGSLKVAHLVSGELAGGLTTSLLALADPAVPSAAKDAARAALTRDLVTLTSAQFLDLADPVVLVDQDGVPQAVSPAGLDNTTRLALAGGQVAGEARTARAERQAVTVVGDRAYAAAATPLVLHPPDGPDRFVGVVVVGTRLDDTYLRRIDRAGEPLSLALVTPDAVLATAGTPPPAARLRSTARAVIDQGARPSRVVGGRFVVARPVVARDQDPQLTLVVSVPTSSIEATRTTLFRTLFLVALGAALLAVALAVVLGERIGGGLRRLTAAAEAVSGGDLTASTGVRSDDELGVLGTAFDTMTGSLRSMTGALRQSAADEARLRNRLQAVIGGMSEALLAADTQGRVVECNRAAEELLGLPVEDVRGRLIDDVVALRSVDGDRRLSVQHPPGASPHPPGTSARNGEGQLARPGASESIPVAFSTATLSGGGAAEQDAGGSVTMLRDLRAERQVEDMKTEFLANIGHELRTPLTPIKGYASALQRRPASPEQVTGFAGEIASGVDQLERVVDQLVNFATMAAGRLELSLEAVDPARLVDATVQRWADRIDDRHALQGRAIAPLPEVRVDRRLLDQALDELVDNALKYSPVGGLVVVSASLGPETDEVTLRVTDEGVGIDPERSRLLTAGFAQADSSATRRFGGLGLGLALADRIVRAHGGHLEFAPSARRGTSVSLILPTQGVRPIHPRSEPEPAP